MKKSFEIYSDCLDIVKRLKEIDKDYFVVYNIERKTFELHNRAQERDTFCLTLPYDTLDERAIFLTKKTLSKKRDELFKEIGVSLKDREDINKFYRLPGEETEKVKIVVKDMVLDLHLSIVKHNDKEVELTRNEFHILYYFFMNPDKLITKEELLDYLWNEKYYLDDNILNVNLNRLRKKLKEIDQPDFIKTIRGQGYQI